MKRNNYIALSLSALALAAMASCGNKSADATDTVDSTSAVDTAVVEQVDSAAIAADAARQDSIAQAAEAARKDSIAKAEEAAKPKADPKIEKDITKLGKLISNIGKEGHEDAYMKAHELCSSLWGKESQMTPEQKKKFKDIASRLGE